MRAVTLGDIRDRGEVGLFFCNWTPARWLPMCAIPTEEEIAAETTDCGKALDPDACLAAQEVARRAIASANFCELKPDFWGKVKCEFETGAPGTGVKTLALATGAVLLAIWMLPGR